MKYYNRLFIIGIIYSVITLCSPLNIFSATNTQPWVGKVVGISDGDTITVMQDRREVKIRLAEIDCPEKGQAFGKAAKQLTSELCFNQFVFVQVDTVDRYGRYVAHVMLPDGQNLSEELIRCGMARHYKRYSSNLHLSKLEIEAKTKGVGIWSRPDSIPPWQWRHNKRQRETSPAANLNQTDDVYSGNVKSQVFHRIGCRHYDCSHCIDYFDSREDAMDAGYRPCRLCKP